MNGYILTHSFCSSCVWGENGYYNAICAHCPYCQYEKKEEPSWMSRETACTSCTHREVYKHKEGYLKVCEAASNINVTLTEHYEDGVRARIIPVANFDCVGYIEVHCKHYERATDIIRSNAYV